MTEANTINRAVPAGLPEGVMSQYYLHPGGQDRLRALLHVVRRKAPRVRSDAARFYVEEVAQAACRGLITTRQGSEWGSQWLVTAAGMRMIEKARA